MGTSLVYAEDVFHKIEARQQDCPCVKAGCNPYGMHSDGYGRKIATPYMVRFEGKGPWRRVYCCCFSNNGTLYVEVKGKHYHFRQDENLRSVGEWPSCIAGGK